MVERDEGTVGVCVCVCQAEVEDQGGAPQIEERVSSRDNGRRNKSVIPGHTNRV